MVPAQGIVTAICPIHPPAMAIKVKSRDQDGFWVPNWIKSKLILQFYPYGNIVSRAASFHSHAEEKSLVKCLFNFCSVNYDVMLVVCDVFNVAMCTNDLMFARWQVNEAD